MRERIGYLHLPKAAGSSVVEALEAHVGADGVCPWRFDHHLLGDITDWDSISHPVFRGDARELRAHRLVAGHFTLPTLLAAFEPADVAVIVREPRARLVSQYAYWRTLTEDEHRSWGQYQAARVAQRPLGEFVRTAHIAHVTDNLALRLVLGPHPLVPVHDFIADTDIDELVDQAWSALESLGHLDLLERGADVFDALARWLGASLHVGRRNVTEVEDAPSVDLADLGSAATIAAVHDRSAADLELWHRIAARRGISARGARALADTTATARLLALAETRPALAVGAADAPASSPMRQVADRAGRFLRRR
ncbi:MAG: hypothetical protein KDB21_04920 [Acidimicrobiales bacterium]|nr:hypothetical protein [Acidimicrobiales bacterium]